eukprot:TRINITY_DN108807_c0_g1_i1.p1 TRINITY_DN108807_c0_g1~~TRINITY_DN108807_c0_g1_i1.p1  ORF type:complete len:310 (-),score=33.66 TRINITY_DN108807_c0_g1_i1:28-936(-)
MAMDGWDGGDGDDYPVGSLRSVSTPHLWAAGVVLLVTFLVLPERLVVHGATWRLQQKLRREVLHVFQSVVQSPSFRPIVNAGLWCIKKLTGGRLASKCLSPHDLRCKASGGTEVMVLWSGRYPSNPFHEQDYICAWRRCPEDGNSTEPWEEQLITTNTFRASTLSNGNSSERSGAFLELPERSCLRVRVCAVNHHGRSDWSADEVEVRTASRLEPTRLLAKTCIVNAEGTVRCVQCSRAISLKSGAMFQAQVVCRPIFAPGCPHGPFCFKCQARLSAQVLPCCVCRALVDSWQKSSPEAIIS